jgi:hypothetical protein
MLEIFQKKDYVRNFLLALTAGTVYCISIMSFGPGITDDSINYLSAASSFPELLKVDGSAYTEWPPLYPALLSLYKISGMNILHFAAMLNGLSFCLSIVIFHSITKDYFQNKFIYWLYIICLVFSLPLLQSFVFVWSEAIFILLILITITYLNAYIKKPDVITFSLLIILSMLMCLQRKSGIIFTGAFAVILLINKPKDARLWIFKISAFFLISVAPFFLWTYRRYLINGSATSGAIWEPDRIWENIRQTIDILSSWIMPDEIPLFIRGIILAACIAVFIFIFRRSRPNISEEANKHITFNIITLITYVLALCLIFLYLKADEPIDDRLLSPVYLFFIFCVFWTIDQVLVHLQQIIRRKIIMFLIILLPLYFTTRTGFHIIRWNKNGTGGYNTKTWADNTIIKNLIAAKPSVVLSNNIYVLSYYLNFRNNSGSVFRGSKNKIPEQHFIIAYFSKEQSHVSAAREDIKIGTEKGEILYQGKEGIIIKQ